MRNIALRVIFPACLFFSCMDEKSSVSETNPCSDVTYSGNVKPIIDLHCAITGCHVHGFLPGDFTSYEGLYEQVQNGFFELKVLDQKIMPPGDSLNESDLTVLQCWVDNGAQDN